MFYIIIITLISLNSYAFSDRDFKCLSTHTAASAACAGMGSSSCGVKAQECVTACGFVNVTGAELTAVRLSLGGIGATNDFLAKYKACSGWSGSRSVVAAGATCESFDKPDATLSAMDDADLGQCKDICLAVTPQTSKTKAIAAKCHKFIETAPAAEDDSDVDTATDDPPGTDTDNNPTPDEPGTDTLADDGVNNGTTNGMNNGGLDFGGTTSASDAAGTGDLGSYDPANWATGPSANPDLFRSAADAASSAAQAEGNFSAPDSMVGKKLDGAQYLGNAPQKDAAASNNGGTGGGAPPSPYMGGMNGGGISGGGSPRPGNSGGGGRYAGGGGAGSQLGKVGQNIFYSGGGSGVPSGRHTATAAKKKSVIAPKYKSKTNDGGSALARMFGTKPAAYGYKGGAAGGSKCLDTVFCNVEGFFNKVDRYPNSEINWNHK